MLNTVTPEQVDVISEFAHNLLYTLPLNAEEQRLIKRRRFLKDIESVKRSVGYRRGKIVKHSKPLLELFDHFTDSWLTMLNAV